MNNQDEFRVSEVSELHSYWSIALSEQLKLTKDPYPLKAVLLRMLLNAIDRMDDVAEAAKPSWEDYAWQCRDFLQWLDYLDLGTLQMEHVQASFPMQIFIKAILATTAKDPLDAKLEHGLSWLE